MNVQKIFSLRALCFTVFVSLLVLYTFPLTIFKMSLWNQNIEMNTKNIPRCYLFSNDLDGINGAVLNENTTLEYGRSIFFIITTCSDNNTIALKPRQACAIESAALHNPNRNVFVLFTSPVTLSIESDSSFVAVLKSYANVHILNVNLRTIALGTLVEELFQKDVMFTSKYVVEHMSDILRIVVLYKYGGIYFDTDVVVQRNMDELPVNFLGKEAPIGEAKGNVNNAILGFQDDVGHEILELCLKDLVTSYKPDVWNYNGGLLITRVLSDQVCHSSLEEMTPEKCRGLKVFPPKEFYAINWFDWEQFFNASQTEFVLETIKGSSVVHLWNKISHSQNITKSKSKTAYEVLAEGNCPNVFNATGEHF